MRISDWSSDVCSSDLFALGKPKQLGNRRARQLVPAWAGIPAIPGLKILDRIVEILIDLPGRHGFHPDIAFGQVIEKRTSIEAMVRNHHGIVISLRQEIRELEIGRASCRERVCQYV